jgi:hypothetical protein
VQRRPATRARREPRPHRVDNPAMRLASVVSRFVCSATLTVWLCFGSATAADGLLWFDGDRPSPLARQAVELLAAAARHGRDPIHHRRDCLE